LKTAAVPAGKPQQQQQVVDAGGVVVLPSASYRSFLFPSINQLCFVLQPGRPGSLVRVLQQLACIERVHPNCKR
jgi:hypothetical protein